MSEAIRVIIADDHPLFRDGVSHTLQIESDIEVIGEASTADEALQLTMELLPDVVLLDIDMPGGGLRAVQTIASVCPMTRIVMLTASADEDDIVNALKAGARGYILKGVSARELVGIVRDIHAGAGYVPPTLAANLLAYMTGATTSTRAPNTLLDELTPRERQILERVAAGSSNREIGQHLHLSEKTVKYYMSNILQKLQVRNRVEAALLVQRGVVVAKPGESLSARK